MKKEGIKADIHRDPVLYGGSIVVENKASTRLLSFVFRNNLLTQRQLRCSPMEAVYFSAFNMNNAQPRKYQSRVRIIKYLQFGSGCKFLEI